MATDAERVKALLRAGLKHTDIVQLVKEQGREAVLQLGEDALKEEINSG